MTSRQRDVLVTIHRLITVKGYTPSYQEIADELGLASLATVHKHLVNLERIGYLTKAPKHSRGLDFTSKGFEFVASQDRTKKWKEEASKLRAALIEIESSLTTDRVSKEIARIALGWGT